MLFSRADLRRLLIPLLLEQALVVLIGMMDTVMVSSCGEAAVSGVSLVDSVNILLINVFSALATGGAVVTSQYLGKRDRENAGKAAKMLFYVVLLCSTVIMAVCLILRRPILSTVFGAIEPEVMEAAMTYFLLSALSYPFLAMYNGSCALLRAMGDAKTTLYSSAAMNVINICGNALTIYGLGWGVMGAGLATLVSRMVGAAVTQLALHNPHGMIPYPNLRRWEWQGNIVRMILHVGVPNGMENGLFQMGKLLLLGMVSTFGTVSIAANAVGNSITTFQVLPGSAVGLAMITVVGRCVGAHEFEQARYYIKRLMLLAYACMSVLNIVMLLFTPLLASAYHLSPETEALARQIVMIHGIGCVFIWPASFVLPNALRAAGDTRFTMMVSVFSMLAFRVVSGYLLGSVLGLGVIGVWLAMQIDWLFRVALFFWRLRSGRWESKALV